MRRCLIVEGSSVVRRVARRIIEEMKFTVSEADDVQIALDKCRDSMPDAVLLDRNMPGMDGIEFVKAVRKESGGNKPKIIYCTPENDPDDIRRVLDAGADEYMMKPFDRGIVQSKFREAGLLR